VGSLWAFKGGGTKACGPARGDETVCPSCGGSFACVAVEVEIIVQFKRAGTRPRSY
jgi:hypothetical protein